MNKRLILLLLCICYLFAQYNVVQSQISEVVIIEETKDRSHLPASQLALMNSNSFIESLEKNKINFLGCFDINIIDKSKQVPEELKPYIELAKNKTLPILGYKDTKVRIIELPLTEQESLKVLGCSE